MLLNAYADIPSSAMQSVDVLKILLGGCRWSHSGDEGFCAEVGQAELMFLYSLGVYPVYELGSEASGIKPQEGIREDKAEIVTRYVMDFHLIFCQLTESFGASGRSAQSSVAGSFIPL